MTIIPVRLISQSNVVPSARWCFHSNRITSYNVCYTKLLRVTGTVAQSTNNAAGVAGVAFGASIMPIKVLDAEGAGDHATVAEGIIYAADHGAKVINLSLGGSDSSNTLKEAVAYAYNKGVTIVAASGT